MISLLEKLRTLTPGKGALGGALHVWDDPGFIFVSNAKAVCSTTKLALNTALSERTGQPYAPQNFEALHDRRIGLMKFPFQLPEDRLAELLECEGTERFTFVRDPMARLISAISSKLAPADNLPHRTSLLNHLGLPNTHIFHPEELAEIFLADTAALNSNKHWRPQHTSIGYGTMPYTAIGRAESWDRDFALITTRIFGAPIPVIDTRSLFGHQTPQARHSSEATPRLRKLVEQIYAADYAMLEDIKAKGLAPA